ncbi:MAG: class I SAM-dependent methyltransferase [candidate division KSB1 bacterium]|jgi:demethylmenaquinone methyltransferase/2-methoxy-6-polyprenyl-1,4-benzoquinol methylase|nr:class I SAM-dependent methyltransferase [candidate division KSB1 bacterium]
MLDHFSLLAPLYDRLIGPPNHEKLRDFLRLPSSGWMLDAGGGTGRVSSTLRPLVDHLVVSDLSRPMLLQAQRKGNLCSIQAHVERLPFPADTFERVLVVDALHHFCDQRESLGDLLRVLKPGGRLLIEEPNIHRVVVKGVAVAEKLALMRSRFLSPEMIRDIIASYGYSAAIRDHDRFRAWIFVDKE